MKYANFYDLESLTLLNRHEGCACSIKECDVEKVNRLISRMRQDRERVSLPTAGDVVTYITRGGDYYPQAHIERGDDREVHICLLPKTGLWNYYYSDSSTRFLCLSDKKLCLFS